MMAGVKEKLNKAQKKAEKMLSGLNANDPILNTAKLEKSLKKIKQKKKGM